jgi:hypothetical protein
MANKLATRSSGRVLSAEFIFNLTDTMDTTAGVNQAFSTAAGVYDVIRLPAMAYVVGGEIVVETASNDSSTATLAVGDSASAARYLAATSIKTAARTALVPTGFVTTGNDLRITLANAGGDATAGKVRVRVEFVIQNNVHENN